MAPASPEKNCFSSPSVPPVDRKSSRRGGKNTSRVAPAPEPALPRIHSTSSSSGIVLEMRPPFAQISENSRVSLTSFSYGTASKTGDTSNADCGDQEVPTVAEFSRVSPPPPLLVPSADMDLNEDNEVGGSSDLSVPSSGADKAQGSREEEERWRRRLGRNWDAPSLFPGGKIPDGGSGDAGDRCPQNGSPLLSFTTADVSSQDTTTSSSPLPLPQQRETPSPIHHHQLLQPFGETATKEGEATYRREGENNECEDAIIDVEGEGEDLELIESDAPFCMPDLGAEVVVVSGGEEEDAAMSPATELRRSPRNLNKANSSINNRVEYSRRCSYEEMVYQEEEEEATNNAERPAAERVRRGRGCDSSGTAGFANILSEQENGGERGGGRVPTLEECLAVLTRWALSLQDLYDDRQASDMNAQQNSRCRCEKADALVRDFKRVEDGCYEAIDLQDKIDADRDLLPLKAPTLNALANELRAMQRRLCSSVSILLSAAAATSATSTSPDAAASRAAALVSEVCDARSYVRDATDSLVRLVCDLMGVGECGRHEAPGRGERAVTEGGEGEGEAVDEDVVMKEGEEEMKGQGEIDQEEELQALFLEEDEDEGEGEDGDAERQNRKRKSSAKSPPNASKTPPSSPPPSTLAAAAAAAAAPARGSSSSAPTSPTSPTSSPTKRARRGRTLSVPVGRAETDLCLRLLETKRKGVRADGLRQFVLWREALRAEKGRKVEQEMEAMMREQEEELEREEEEDKKKKPLQGRKLNF